MDFLGGMRRQRSSDVLSGNDESSDGEDDTIPMMEMTNVRRSGGSDEADATAPLIWTDDAFYRRRAGTTTSTNAEAASATEPVPYLHSRLYDRRHGFHTNMALVLTFGTLILLSGISVVVNRRHGHEVAEEQHPPHGNEDFFAYGDRIDEDEDDWSQKPRNTKKKTSSDGSPPLWQDTSVTTPNRQNRMKDSGEFFETSNGSKMTIDDEDEEDAFDDDYMGDDSTDDFNWSSETEDRADEAEDESVDQDDDIVDGDDAVDDRLVDDSSIATGTTASSYWRWGSREQKQEEQLVTPTTHHRLLAYFFWSGEAEDEMEEEQHQRNLEYYDYDEDDDTIDNISYAAHECNNIFIHTEPGSERRCQYAKTCNGGEGVFASFVFCNRRMSLNAWCGLLCPVLAIWLVILFRLLGSTAEDFFSPSLEMFSMRLGLPPRFAGVSLLALGNGAADVSATMNAILQNPHSGYKLSLGALTGAGMFISTVVAGSIIIVADGGVKCRGALIRDVVAFGTAVVVVFCFFQTGKIGPDAIGTFFGLYLLFVAIVLVADVYHRAVVLPREARRAERRERRRQLDEGRRAAAAMADAAAGQDVGGVGGALVANPSSSSVTPVRGSTSNVESPPASTIHANSPAGDDGEKPSEITTSEDQSNIPALTPAQSREDNFEDEPPAEGTGASTSPSKSNINSEQLLTSTFTAEDEDDNTHCDSVRGNRTLNAIMTTLSNYDRADSASISGVSVAAGASETTTSPGGVPTRPRLHRSGWSFDDGGQIANDLGSDGGRGHEVGERDRPIILHGANGLLTRHGKGKPKQDEAQHGTTEVETPADGSSPYCVMLDGDDAQGSGMEDVCADPANTNGTPPAYNWNGAWHDGLAEMKAYCLDTWDDVFKNPENSTLDMILLVLEMPLTILRKLTIPIPCPGHYCRPLIALSMALSPVWLGFYFKSLYRLDLFITGGFPTIGILTVVAMILAALVLRYAPGGEGSMALPFSVPIALFGFVVAATWIDIVAHTLVRVLAFFGVVLRIPDPVMGLTVLAWGNSMSDLSANVTMARKGLSNMAMTACFAGPVFTLLVGFGSGFSALSGKSGKLEREVQLTPSIMAGFAFALFNCIMVLVTGVIIFRGVIPKRFGYVTMGLYGIYVTTSLILQFLT